MRKISFKTKNKGLAIALFLVIKLRYSFDPERPVIAAFQVQNTKAEEPIAPVCLQLYGAISQEFLGKGAGRCEKYQN